MTSVVPNIFRKKIVYFIPLCLVALACIVTEFISVTITGNWEGIYLLRGKMRNTWELKDDLYLNEGKRHIAGVDFSRGKMLFKRLPGTVSAEPNLYFSWNEQSGAGYVRNYLPQGKQLLTCFSRFIDDGGKISSGLFVGGGLPSAAKGDDRVKRNETGMAYYDGTQWYHLWCNVNEAIFSSSSFTPISPSAWTFRGSRILHQQESELVLESIHEVTIDGTPLHIDRYASFKAGDTYFVLSVVMQNIGNRPVTFSYLYADEPWLGNYGSSEGNIGWAEDGLHAYIGSLNTERNHYAGMFDYGNEVIGEAHIYTMLANFIEWTGSEKPYVYFSNGPYDIPRNNQRKTPLSGNERYLGVLWGPRTLEPGMTVTYTMAIGMAGRDPKSGFPVKPATVILQIP